MAIVPSAQFPGQIITGDPGYPHGKPRNVTVSGDGTGTPLRAQWVADLFGWQQELLDRAGIAPSGEPDQVGASDYMDAFDILYPSIGRMTTAESDIGVLQGRAGDLEDAVAALGGRLDTAEGDINALAASRVTGPASATDNALARFDATTGKLVQNSVVTVGDTGAMAGVSTLAASGQVTLGAGVSAVGEYVYPLPKTRTVQISAAAFTRAGTDWNINVDAGQLRCSRLVSTTRVDLYMDLRPYVREGQAITGCEVLVNVPARATTSRMELELYVNGSLDDSQFDNSSAGTQTIVLSALSGFPVGALVNQCWIIVKGGANTGGGHTEHVYTVTLEISDNGPRSN